MFYENLDVTEVENEFGVSSHHYTPVVELPYLSCASGAQVFAKLEKVHPSQSIKYRAANFMVKQGMIDGRLKPGGSVIESSSGNLGAALAWVCREHGLRFICVVDPNAQQENIDLVTQYGGTVEKVHHKLNGCFLKARLARIAHMQKVNSEYYWTNQYANTANLMAHYYGTATEIYDHFGETLDYICVATSSTGTLGGIQLFFKQYSPRTKIVAVDLFGSVLYRNQTGDRKISGVGAGVRPVLADYSNPDEVLWCSDADAVVGCHRAMHYENLSIGGSSGAVIESILANKNMFANKRVLAIFPDGGEKYQRTVFNDEWLNNELGMSIQVVNSTLKIKDDAA